METVGEEDQGHSHNVMEHQLLKVLSGLLQLKHQDDTLLGPEGSLKKIKGLEKKLVGLVGIVFIEGGSVEVPDRGVVHNVQTKRTHETIINDRIGLLHESVDFALLGDPVGLCNWAENDLHAELAEKGKEEHIKRDKRKVLWSFAVLNRISARNGVG